MATAANGFTKYERINVMSAASPIDAIDIETVALGARIMARIQTSLGLPAAMRAEFVTAIP